MILSDGTVISRSEVSPYKFGGDPMAEYLWTLSLDSSYDRCTGDACDWGQWVAQYGKRLQQCDSQGFVWVVKFVDVESATAAFDEIESDFNEWDSADQLEADL